MKNWAKIERPKIVLYDFYFRLAGIKRDNKPLLYAGLDYFVEGTMYGTRDSETKKLQGLVRYLTPEKHIEECSYLDGQKHGLSITYDPIQICVQFF